MKSLVIGGGGFLGRHLVAALLLRGHQVSVLARGHYPDLQKRGVTLHRGDLVDHESVMSAVQGVDSVFLVAARVGYWGDARAYFATNVLGARHVLSACRAKGVRNLVYTSTPSVVIGPRGGIEGGDESLAYPTRYLFAYAETKAQAEREVLSQSGTDHLWTGAIRPHFIVGPDDPHIVPRLLARHRSGQLRQIGDGQNLVDLTDVSNAVEAHLLLHDALNARKSSVSGQAFFIGQERPVRLWDFVQTILQSLGEAPLRQRLSLRSAYLIGAGLEWTYRLCRRTTEPPLTRAAAVMLGTSHYFSHEKAHRLLGYTPRVTLDETYQRILSVPAIPASAA